MKVSLIFLLLGAFGCQPTTTFTTRHEYIEEQKWEKEKGLVKNSKGSWTLEWGKAKIKNQCD